MYYIDEESCLSQVAPILCNVHKTYTQMKLYREIELYREMKLHTSQRTVAIERGALINKLSNHSRCTMWKEVTELRQASGATRVALHKWRNSSYVTLII